MTARTISSCRMAAALLIAVTTTSTLPAAAVYATPDQANSYHAANSKRDEKRQNQDTKNKGKKLGHQKQEEPKAREDVQTERKEAQQQPEQKTTQPQQPAASAPAASNSQTTNSKGRESAKKNNPAYWEALGYGVCVKYDGISTKTFTVPSSNQSYSLAVVKSGSFASVSNPNETDETVAAGDVLTHSSGKDISHVILCQKASTVVATPKKDACPEVPGMQDNKKQCKLEQVIDTPQTSENKPETSKPSQPGKVLQATDQTAAVPGMLPSTGLGAIVSILIALSASAVAYGVTLFTKKKMANSN